jgi:glycerol-3-phosphate acyltransferase PlsX
MIKIAIDAMGGDNGPSPIIEGLILALKKVNPHLINKNHF